MPACVFLIISLVFTAGSALAADIDFAGKYVGYGYVSGRNRESVRTDVRMEIRKEESGDYIVEMNYLDGKTARFGKATRKSDTTLLIKEEVNTGGARKASAEGRLHTSGGAQLTGTIEVREAGAGSGALPETSIRIMVSRLKEQAVSAP